MIRIILKGGLGNQMFQYSFGKCLSIKNKVPLLLDTCMLDCRIPVKDFTIRNYELDLFNIEEQPYRQFQNNLYKKYFAYPKEKIISKFNHKYIVEGSNPYYLDQEMLNKISRLKYDAVLEGYWNNYQYFDICQNQIRNIFNTVNLFDNRFVDIEEKIRKMNSVSINIRRGDYLNSKHKNVFVYLDNNYYQKAINLIREKVTKPHFFIFSIDFPDVDANYFAQELRLNRNEITLIDRNYIGDRFRTYLRLISICKHNIISNSTFAFWGAYLNINPNPTIVAPAKWMNNNYIFESPPSWHSI